MRRLSGNKGAALFAGLGLALSPAAAHAEVCRYDGTASHGGQVAVRAEVTAAAGVVTVDVTLALTATTMWFLDMRYLVHEISTYRRGEVESIAVNARQSVSGSIKRQQWDVFVRGAGGLEARRVQAKTLADFGQRHPGFVRYWTPAMFGQPWLQDYAAAAPERRPDLDLPRADLPPGLRPPLALAFYWSRWLAPGGMSAPVFLPGFKQQSRADIPFGAAEPGEGWQLWRAPLRHAGLSGAPASTATVRVSPDRRLLQLAFDAHARGGSVQGVVRAQGCQGVPVAPADQMR